MRTRDPPRAMGRDAIVYRKSRFRLSLGVAREGGQTLVVARPTHREVVEALDRHTPQSEHAMGGIIEVAADARGAHTGGLGLEVQHLTDQTRLPEQAAVEPGSQLDQRSGELGEHRDAERAVAGDLLA